MKCRNQLAKLNSAIELQSKIQPFSFDTKPAAAPDMSHHHDELMFNEIEPNNEHHCFRAKPCPKNLFSNYFYHKMWEEEYFRALNRKLRAEELLKISTLPPSMRRRELQGGRCSEQPPDPGDGDVASSTNVADTPRTTTTPTQTIRSSSAMSTKGGRQRRRRGSSGGGGGGKKKSDYCHLTTKVNSSGKPDEFITTCPRPFEFETEKRSTNRKSKKVGILHVHLKGYGFNFITLLYRIVHLHQRLAHPKRLQLMTAAAIIIQVHHQQQRRHQCQCIHRQGQIWLPIYVWNGLKKSCANFRLGRRKHFPRRNCHDPVGAYAKVPPGNHFITSKFGLI